MRGRGICLLLAVALLFGCCGLVGCRRGMDKQTSSFFLMDTLITVTLYTNDAEAAEAIFTECRVLLGELDALWARQNGTGEVARFNLCAEGVSALDARTVSLLESALAVSRATDGAFDVTVAPLVELWERCGEADRLPTEAELAAAMETVGYGRLSLSGAVLSKSDARVQIDLGGNSLLGGFGG